MKKNKLYKFSLLISIIFLLTTCGGGGGGESRPLSDYIKFRIAGIQIINNDYYNAFYEWVHGINPIQVFEFHFRDTYNISPLEWDFSLKADIVYEKINNISNPSILSYKVSLKDLDTETYHHSPISKGKYGILTEQNELGEDIYIFDLYMFSHAVFSSVRYVDVLNPVINVPYSSDSYEEKQDRTLMLRSKTVNDIVIKYDFTGVSFYTAKIYLEGNVVKEMIHSGDQY